LAHTYRLLRPLLLALPAEAAHRVTLQALRLGLIRSRLVADDPVLAGRVWGLDFSNPVGLAAGFDKNAEAVDALLGLGFGFVEVGTITPRPQPGNPKPRVFRLAEDRAVINRLGFNSQGLPSAVRRLERRGGRARAGVVGANVGTNWDSADAAADYAAGVGALGPVADYLVMNVSSPNTPGLRDLQTRPRLMELIERAKSARASAAKGGRGEPEGGGPPLLLKIAPDLSEDELRDVAEVVFVTGIDGLVVTNTTVSRPDGLEGRFRNQAGGLSGAPLFARSTEVLRQTYRLTGGRIPLIGVGGVSSGRDAYAKIRAGASLVQLYTALVYEGPGLVGRIKAELAELLRGDGFAHVADAVGADA
jgi:dihydroorotate dehydrogenase